MGTTHQHISYVFSHLIIWCQLIVFISCVCFTSEERESWIRAKYEQRAFVAALQPAPGPQLPGDSMPVWLLSAVTERDLPRLLLLLAHSTKDQINAELSGSTSPPRTALHAACQLGDVVMTQLLVWVGFSFFFSTQRPVLYSDHTSSHPSCLVRPVDLQIW